MNALYTVVENKQEHYFLSRIAGGYSYPFVIFSYAERMAELLNKNNPMGKIEVSELFPLLKANKDFPEKFSGEKLFCPISETVFCEREAEMSHSDYIPLSITLDFDERKIGFIFNQNCPDLLAPKIEIPLNRADAQEAFGKINPLLKDVESFYQTELMASVLDSPVFVVKINSDQNAETGSGMLPMSEHNQRELKKELETKDLDSCKILAGWAFDRTLNNYFPLESLTFSQLNRLALELNKLRLDCGDVAFNDFAKAVKIESIDTADRAMEIVEGIRKGFAAAENQDMGYDLKM